MEGQNPVCVCVCVCVCVWASPVSSLSDESPAGLHLNIQASLHGAHLHVLVQVSVHVTLCRGQFQLESENTQSDILRMCVSH